MTGLRRCWWLASCLSAATLGLASLPAVARPATKPVIATVTFAGGAANPQVVITGTGFGSEPPPSNLAYQGYTGEDYGDALYVCDQSADPATFCAGQNDGSGSGDTIGLVVSAYAGSQIDYSLGSAYAAYYYKADVYRLQNGDKFTVHVDGSTCSGVVAFGVGPVSCPATPPPTTTTTTTTTTTPATTTTPTTTTPALVAAPADKLVPTISGRAVQGALLSDVHGTWDGSPTSFAYQWQRCDPSGVICNPIPGATAATYTPTAADVGQTIEIQETAANSGGPGLPASSGPTTSIEPALVLNRKLHRRIVLAAAKLLAHKGAQVRFSVTLTGRLAASLAVPSGVTLRGAGAVDFRDGDAKWSLSLPSSLGGNSLQVVTRGKNTFVALGELTSNAPRRWLRVGGNELTRIPKLGFVGELAMLMNPYQAVKLLESTTSDVSAKNPDFPAEPARPGGGSGGEQCSFTPGIDSGQTTLNPKKLVDVAKDWRDTEQELFSALSDGYRLSAGYGVTGAAASFELFSSEGLTISGRFCTAAEPGGIYDPPPGAITSLKAWLTIDPCLVGVWRLVGNLPNPSGEPIATGTVLLTIEPTGTARLVYDEIAIVPDGDYGASGVFGTANLTVAAPVSTQDLLHRLVWGILDDGVVQVFPGVETEVPGDPPLEVDTPPLTLPVGPSGAVISKYSCDVGAKTLNVAEPIGNDQTLSFVRLSDPYVPPKG